MTIQPTIRLATHDDIDSLVEMRWDFTLEDDTTGRINEEDFVSFYVECQDFLAHAIEGERWFIWVADVAGEVASHIYIQVIDKVPRPGRVTKPFAYMTNVYTRPQFRGQSIGSQLITGVNEWTASNGFEFVIVWPSDTSVAFYRHNGYENCTEPMEYKV